MGTSDFVRIYYDQLTDLFAIVESKENRLLDFGIATEVKYAKIFAYKSSGTLKSQEICLLTNQRLQDLIPQNPEYLKYKELEVYKENYILSKNNALAILEVRYGSNFIVFFNGEFKIQEWQAAKN